MFLIYIISKEVDNLRDPVLASTYYPLVLLIPRQNFKTEAFCDAFSFAFSCWLTRTHITTLASCGRAWVSSKATFAGEEQAGTSL